MKKTLTLLAVLQASSVLAMEQAMQRYETKAIKNISYLTEPTQDAYRKEMSQLDLYLPDGATNFPTLVYFHGGGLTAGRREAPTRLVKEGIATVAVDYRIYPNCKHPAFIEDCAAATAWVFKNIEKYGGNPNKIFIGGYSAGAYLTAMLAMDKKYLATQGIDADRLAGALPQSGQLITHFSVRKELGYREEQGVCDENSPMYHIRETPFPILLQCGNDDYPSRQEENRLFESMMIRYAKQPRNLIEYREYDGTHATLGLNSDFQEDTKIFILKNSGLPYFPRERDKSQPAIWTRSSSGKTFFDLSEVKKQTGATGVLINGEILNIPDSGILPMKETCPTEIMVVSKCQVDPVAPIAEYHFKDGKNGALTAPGGVKFWTESGMLFVEFKKGQSKAKVPQNGVYYSGDGIEIFVDRAPFQNLKTASTQNKSRGAKQFLFSVLPDADGKSFAVKDLSLNLKDITETSAVTTKTDGDIMQVSIPLSEIAPQNDESIIGLNIKVNDYDSGKCQSVNLSGSNLPSHAQRFHYPLFKIDAFKNLEK